MNQIQSRPMRHNCLNCGMRVDDLLVCPKCDYHMRLNARQRLDMFLDPGSGREIAEYLGPADPLKFRDSKKYRDRIVQAQKSTGEKDALIAKTTPLLFRVHEEPPEEKLDSLRNTAEAAGFSLAKGQVLTCQAQCTSDVVAISFDS